MISLIFLLLPDCVPISSGPQGSSASSSPLRFEDATYIDNIKTIQLYEKGRSQSPPTKALRGGAPLMLEFDLLDARYEDLRAKIVHCNADWRPSRLNGMDYLNNYNEFDITDQQLSVNTDVPYTHFRFTLPEITRTGNYLIYVYRSGNPNDLVLSKRFIIFDNNIPIKARLRPSQEISQRRTHHQIDFTLNYGNTNVQNPQQDITVVLRQNGGWHNAIHDLQPSFVRNGEKILEFELFDLTNTFPAGNEYRFFDLRYTRSTGQHVASINEEAVPHQAMLEVDENRGTQAYSQYQDLNGFFIIENREQGGSDLNADYVETTFTLDAGQKAEGEIYITGQLAGDGLQDGSKMQFNPSQGTYTRSLLLKQGYYFYQYYLKSENGNPYKFEGNHYQTENLYEILVYISVPGERADQLVGYERITS